MADGAGSLAQRLDDHADGGGEQRPGHEAGNPLGGPADGAADGRVTAAHALVSAGDQGSGEEDADDRGGERAEHEQDQRQGGKGLFLTRSRRTGALLGKCQDPGDNEDGEHECCAEEAEDGEDDQFTVLLEHAPGGFGQFDGVSDATHGVQGSRRCLLRCRL